LRSHYSDKHKRAYRSYGDNNHFDPEYRKHF